MLAPWKNLRGDGSSPVKTQAGAVSTRSSVEDTWWPEFQRPVQPPVTNIV